MSCCFANQLIPGAVFNQTLGGVDAPNSSKKCGKSLYITIPHWSRHAARLGPTPHLGRRFSLLGWEKPNFMGLLISELGGPCFLNGRGSSSKWVGPNWDRQSVGGWGVDDSYVQRCYPARVEW